MTNTPNACIINNVPHGRLAQLVRALRSHRRGRGFESPIFHQTKKPPYPGGFFVCQLKWGDENSTACRSGQKTVPRAVFLVRGRVPSFSTKHHQIYHIFRAGRLYIRKNSPKIKAESSGPSPLPLCEKENVYEVQRESERRPSFRMTAVVCHYRSMPSMEK